MANILTVRNLSKHFVGRRVSSNPWSPPSVIKSVDGVDLDVGAGETAAIVGESGSGKTTLGRCIVRIYKPTSGEIVLNGTDITRISQTKMRPMRDTIQMVFQDPIGSLNPRREASDLIEDPMRAQGVSRNQRQARSKELLDLVGLAQSHATRYPHEFSGGQRQRIAIARSLSVNPDIIVLDEPVSALDVSIQAQIINLLIDIRKEFNTAYIFISHDLSIVRQIADYVCVMRHGRIVERGPRDRIFDSPEEEYTRNLIKAVPVEHPELRKSSTKR